MSPIVVYRCERGHEYETLYKTMGAVPSPHMPEYCPTCAAPSERVIAAPRLRADGAYSWRSEK